MGGEWTVSDAFGKEFTRTEAEELTVNHYPVSGKERDDVHSGENIGLVPRLTWQT